MSSDNQLWQCRLYTIYTSTFVTNNAVGIQTKLLPMPVFRVCSKVLVNIYENQSMDFCVGFKYN